MVANYLITKDIVKVVPETVSDCSYYVKNEDILLLKNDKECRISLLNELGLDSVIVSSLGDKSEDLYQKEGASIIKVGEKNWI